MMGNDRWGGVLQKVDSKHWDTYIAKACGDDVSAHNSTSPVANNGADHTSVVPAISAHVSSVGSAGPSLVSSILVNSSTVLTPTSTPVKVTTQVHSTFTLSPITSHTTSKPVVTTAKPITTAQPTSSQPTPASSNVSGGSSSSDEQAYLSAHNSFRALHGANALTWSDELAAKAQQWANGCQFKHSGGSLGPYGENLAAGTGSDYGIAAAIKSWTDESSQYNPANPTFSHFTQVVWKATTQLGCAVQSCDGIFDGKAKFYVCEYFPAGNFVGRFAQNVQV